MPGVPSSRGCEACRKQKKKCDQSKPNCSRCRRLQIPCEGSGKQRFTFKEQKIDQKLLIPHSAPKIKQIKFQNCSQVKGIPRAPSNEATMVLGAFTSTLGVTDPRYDISCYGVFLEDMPRRLGRNEALDASVDALTAAFPSLHTSETPRHVLVKYGQSLKMLRKCMSDPKQAQTADTLCAIYMTMICQIWMGKGDDRTAKHAAAMSHILNALAEKEITDRFELEMFVTLTVVLIMDSVINPLVQISPRVLEVKRNVHYGPERFLKNEHAAAIQSLSLKSLAAIPEFMHHPDSHIPEIRASYDLYRIEIPELETRLRNMESTFPNGVVPTHMLRPHSAIQVAFLIINFMALVLNGILVGHGPDDNLLAEQSPDFAHNIFTLAKKLSQHKPLAASPLPMCLTAVWAWALINGSGKLKEVEDIWAEHGKDSKQVQQWREVALWITRIHRRADSAHESFVQSPDLTGSELEIYGFQDFVLYL